MENPTESTVNFQPNSKHTEPLIKVGIMARDKLLFNFPGAFETDQNMAVPAGDYSASVQDGEIVVKQNGKTVATAPSFHFRPKNDDSYFGLKGVTIGVDFHWEQKEDQQFGGSLKLIVEGDKVRAVNIIALEDYLKSVISSEMSSTSSMQLLKAHAVISRSWLLAQVEKSKSLESAGGLYQTSHETETRIERWYDREDHATFDVCADDHCQRYQGVTKIHSGNAKQAVVETFGEVLTANGNICDARFSKCCGGVSENFEYVWEPERHPYLTKVVDSEVGSTTCVDLRREDEADLWIRNKPQAFCNTTDKEILAQVLPDFDQSTTDFYRWEVSYSQNGISALIKKRSGIDFGEIIKLEAVKRGHSSRIVQLKITGTKKTLTVGKELEIRKWLSESHLYSSAFVVEHLHVENGVPQEITLKGAGWGHGVGLCQIGAAVMGAKGYPYSGILAHYFVGATLERLY